MEFSRERYHLSAALRCFDHTSLHFCCLLVVVLYGLHILLLYARSLVCVGLFCCRHVRDARWPKNARRCLFVVAVESQSSTSSCGATTAYDDLAVVACCTLGTGVRVGGWWALSAYVEACIPACFSWKECSPNRQQSSMMQLVVVFTCVKYLSCSET